MKLFNFIVRQKVRGIGFFLVCRECGARATIEMRTNGLPEGWDLWVRCPNNAKDGHASDAYQNAGPVAL